MEPTVNRYPDTDLEEFRQIIVDKLDKARIELEDLRKQVLEITENAEGDFGSDWMDDSSIANDLELLNEMAIRQRKYIQDLENALVRIKNKTYGICVVTGQLIDRKRLLAVPTTTKSIAAKLDDKPRAIPVEDLPPKREVPSDSTSPKIITKIIRKPTSEKGGGAKKDVDDLLDDFTDDESFWEDLNLSDIDPDTIADDTSEETTSYDRYEEDEGGDEE
jgi:RNA polymerase-binding transcription factor DksA